MPAPQVVLLPAPAPAVAPLPPVKLNLSALQEELRRLGNRLAQSRVFKDLQVDLSDLQVDLSDLHVELSDLQVDLSDEQRELVERWGDLKGRQGEPAGGGTETKTFAVTKGGTFELKANGGEVRLSTGEKSEVVVRIDGVGDIFGGEFMGKKVEPETKVEFDYSGNTVRVVTRGGFASHSAEFDVVMPKEFNADITTQGDVALRSPMTGNIRVKTSAGEIRLEAITGSVNAFTSGGSMNARKITGDGLLRTSGGDIEVESATGKLEISTAGGDLFVGNVGKELRAKTSGGDITVGDVAGDAEVKTAGGNIRVGKVSGSVEAKTSGGDIELKGGSGRILAKTSGGNIEVTNATGSVEAKTSGGDIRAELVPTSGGRSELTSSGGNIVLHLPENGKATVEARIRIRDGGGWNWNMGWDKKGQPVITDKKGSAEEDKYKILSDFKADKVEKTDGEIRATYTLGGGGQLITVDTTNGDIEIRKLGKK